MLRSSFLNVTLVTLVSLAVAVLSAQEPQGAGRGGRGGRGPAAGQTVEKIRPLKPNLYMITGGGANTLVRVTSEGLIVVDTKNPSDENYNRVMEEIRSVSALPVKYVFNTHHHPDHVGNNQKFIDAGAKVIALEALKTRMASDPRTKDVPGLPTVTFAKDYVLKFGGAEIQAHSYGRGHTGDDTMVHALLAHCAGELSGPPDVRARSAPSHGMVMAGQVLTETDTFWPWRSKAYPCNHL